VTARKIDTKPPGASLGTSGGAGGGYFDRSRQPLEILAFLAPLIVLHEMALFGALRRGDGFILTNRAHALLIRFFEWAGVDAQRLLLPALSLPAAAIVAVLLSWQVMARRPWSLHLPTVCGMAVESLLTALPIVAFGWLLAALPVAAVPEPRSLGFGAQVALAIGAGVYEEFVFRMVLVSLLHSLLKRLLGASDASAVVAAVTISALLFTLYHPIVHDGTVAWRDAILLFVAGAWWGALFVVRGFGIAVGSHAMYDAIVLTLPLWAAR